MSMTSWHNYGYGINTDKIDIPDENLLKITSPDALKHIFETGLSKLTSQSINELDWGGHDIEGYA